MFKHFLIAAFVLACLMPSTGRAQDGGATEPLKGDDATLRAQRDGALALEEIRKALSQGDVERLMERLGLRIDLTLFGTSERLSRSQAHYVVKSFFAEYPPTRVEFDDATESDGYWFASGGYWYETHTVPLAVYLRLRPGLTGWELRELRFDRPSSQ